MRRSWTERLATLEDSPAIVELFNEVFYAKQSISHWKWKFLDNPCGKVCMFVAQDGNRIVGQFAILPTWMNLHGEKVMGGQVLDIMTHPAYRRKGILASLAEKCLEQAASQNIKVLYVFPNDQSYPKFVNKLGWYDIGKLHKLVKILNPEYLIRRGTHSSVIGALLGKPASLLVKVLKGGYRPRPNAQVRIRKMDISEDGFDSFWKGINDGSSLGIWKDSSYLNWRYLLCPEKEYDILVAEENSTLVGLTVLKCGAVPSRIGLIGNIVDFLCLPDKVVAAELLIDAGLEYLKKQGMDIAMCHMFGHDPFYRLFMRQGFFRRGRSFFRFVVRPNVPDLSSSELLSCKGWQMMEGDIDVF